MIQRLTLADFRNYENREFEFGDGVNVIVGENARGKTNVLEGVFMLGTGESFRAKRTEEMVRFGEELGRVKGIVDTGSEKMDLEVLVSNGMVMGKRVNKKKYLIDGVSRRKEGLVGFLSTVLFRPEDVELISGTPDGRRKFMDLVLSQVSRKYAMDVATYTQALRRRNKVLDEIREGRTNRFSLAYWDRLIIKHGDDLQKERIRLIEYMNDLFKKSEMFSQLVINYQASVVSEVRLMEHAEAEVAVGYTLVGPHKDDWEICDVNRNLATYGSRGEQRMAVLALKMGEIYFLEEQKKVKVLLLLDDVFSELDEIHKKEVRRIMKGRQVIVTTAEGADVENFPEAKVINI